MSTTSNTLADDCSCPRVLGPDPSLDRLRGLVAAGIDQRAASLICWAPELLPSAPAPDRWNVAEWVRAQLVARLPWLRLEAGAADWSLPVALACLLGVAAVVVGGLR